MIYITPAGRAAFNLEDLDQREQHRARMVRRFQERHVRPLLVTLAPPPFGWTPEGGSGAAGVAQ